MKILVIGESCRDVFHYGDCSRLCPDAPVPVFKLVSTFETWGMAKNVENNLLSLGATVDVITNENYKMITKIRYMDNRTNHMFLRVDKNDNKYGKLSIEDLHKVDFNQYDAVVVSDYNKGFLSENILKEISQKHQTTLIDTKRELSEWSNKYCFIKLNNKEYENNIKNINPVLSDKIIVTKGQHGSIYHNKIYSVPKVEVKDTSGAGDTFVAGLCYKFVESKDIEKSINYANECATRVVQKRGVGVI